MPYLLFLLICAIWGSSFILMKKATLAFSPLGVAAWRVAGGAAVLGVLWAIHRRSWNLRPRDAFSLAFVVLLGYSWPYAVQPLLVSRHGSAFIGMTVSFVPLLTVLASAPLLGVYPTRRQLLGVMGGLACMAALFSDGLRRQIPWTDLALAGTVPLNYALTNVLIRRSLSHMPPLALSFLTLAFSTAVLLPLALAAPTERAPTSGEMSVAVASLAFLGIVGTGLGTYMFNKLVAEHGPLFAGMVTYLVPVGAIVFGWLDDETVTPLQLAALVGILLMVAVVQYGAATPRAKPVDVPLLEP